MTKSEKQAVQRVLRLVDGYLSSMDQTVLHAWRGGLMTTGELRQHLRGAIKLMLAKKARHAKR